MNQRIPKHHKRQDICATRPAYREGRIPKAVKVYTINNESKYILIQGVPSVGAMKELIQLCSSYGQVEEHHALDEYPCEDKYTEVYLVKYKKIQSARFAKRKLDDYSFFGGNLHVCYAPEYETVADTREKLQDRRKIVALKIRQHKNASKQTTKATDHAIQSIDDSSPSLPSTSETKGASDSSASHSMSFNHNSEFRNRVDLQELSQPGSSDSQLSISESDNSSSSNFSHGPHSFILPPPPQHAPLHKCVPTASKYEYSRVPSKHSTLPANYDGRILHHSIPLKKDDAAIPKQAQSTNLSEMHGSKESMLIQKPLSACSSAPKESMKIKKDFKSQKQTLRFVPRQAVKRKTNDSDGGSNNSAAPPSFDEIEKKIRKNAFVLRDQQGPADLPGRKHTLPEITPGASRSYHDTIKTIRSKISQVITDSVIPKKTTNQ